EIRDVINLAASLADFGGELPLFAVLRSPVGQLDNAEILFLSQLGMGSLLRGLNHVLCADTDLAVAESSADRYRGYVLDRWRKLSAPVRNALEKTWHGFAAGTKERLRRTARRLGNGPPGNWRRRVDRMANADLLQRCLQESGAYAIYAAAEDGELVLANLD